MDDLIPEDLHNAFNIGLNQRIDYKWIIRQFWNKVVI